MDKHTRRYTVLTLFLVVIFVAGNMSCMNLIITARENQLLTEGGRVVIEAPVKEWQDMERMADMDSYVNGDDDSPEDNNYDDDSGAEGIEDAKERYKIAKDSEESNMQKNIDTESGEEAVDDRYVITNELVEDIISSWNNRTGVTVHKPVSGQITMEKAMTGAKEWFYTMDLEGLDIEPKSTILSMSATLGVASQIVTQEELLEPYYSIWTVNISSPTAKAVIYMSAVTGAVWGAEVNIYSGKADIDIYDKLVNFVTLSDFEISGEQMMCNEDCSVAILEINDSNMFAKMEYLHTPVRYYDYSSSNAGGDYSMNISVGNEENDNNDNSNDDNNDDTDSNIGINSTFGDENVGIVGSPGNAQYPYAENVKITFSLIK